MAQFRFKGVFVVLSLITWVCAPGCGAGKDTGGPGPDTNTDGVDDAGWDTGPDTGADTLPDTFHDHVIDYEEEACAATEVSAEAGIAPVDIIWVVDSSGSMDYEESQVQDNLNAFSAHIAGTGIDYHVILIGSASHMTVPPPLGGSPEFMHIDDSVGSNEALEKVVEHYPDYQDFLRPGAVRHFVAVTDDESDMSAGEFVAALAAFTDPGFPLYTWPHPFSYGFTFHSIVAYGSIPIIGCLTGAAIGRQYRQLTSWTGGIERQVCLTDWSGIFGALETSIGMVTALPCVYDIPDPPEGETLDPDKVNVIYRPGGVGEVIIPRVADATACAGVEYGWYYDDPTDPSQILLCPLTCDIVQADSAGTISIAFGCATVIW